MLRMKRANPALGFALALLALLPVAAPLRAAEKVLVSRDRNGVALQGYDPVAYFTDNRPMRGQATISAVHLGAKYYFVSEEHRRLFVADPDKYAPQFGGYCGYAAAINKISPISPEFFQILDGRLVLQHNQRAWDLWNKDVPGNLKSADANWPGLVEKNGMDAPKKETAEKAATAAQDAAAKEGATAKAAGSDLRVDLDLEAARRVAQTAADKARELGAPGGAIAVVDPAGQPLFLMRLDGSFPIAAEVAIGKARTAALFARPTKVLEDSINQGRPALLAVLSQPGTTPLRGGVPLLHAGRLVGAIGVSGAASAAQDEEIALAGAALDPLRPVEAVPAPRVTGELAIAPELPDAIADLRTAEGAALVAARWSYRDAAIVATEHREPGPDRKATGEPNTTHDLSPKPSDAAFLEGFAPIAPTELETRRGHGRLGFGWYHLELTLPEKLGNQPVAGATAVFELVVDDVAEIWVDGKLPQVLGQRGGQLAAGWNAPNRVVLSREAQPGQKFELAILALNAPISEPPANYVWIRSATLDLYAPGRYDSAVAVPLAVRRFDAVAGEVLPADPLLERVATGFTFTEGPVWQKESAGLLFSDPNRNVIYRLDGEGNVTIYRTKSGYTGADIGEYRQPGSNGLGIDKEGRLLIAEHGNRRISRLERNGSLTVLADRFDGKRLNSPNDLILRADGTLFFSDPPFGLPQFHADPRRELKTTGVYCLMPGGELRQVVSDLNGPNGVALSPDQRYLYVGNWDDAKKVVMRYEVGADCTVSEAKVFFDLTAEPGEEAIDGVEVDLAGRIYVSGPGGLWIVSPEGRPLAALRGPEQPANFAWGEDGKTLFWTARTSVYRLRLDSRGF